MSCRRNSIKEQDWKGWIEKNNETLLKCGLPQDLFKSEERWWYFLKHNYDYKTNWQIESLSVEECEKLYEFLKHEYKHNEISTILDYLKYNVLHFPFVDQFLCEKHWLGKGKGNKWIIKHISTGELYEGKIVVNDKELENERLNTLEQFQKILVSKEN